MNECQELGMKAELELLEQQIENPSLGLPKDIFLFVSKITPMINVDLFIRNDQAHTLLTWREDGIGPPGWHIPGGIVRFKERMADRIAAVAGMELGTTVTFIREPLAIREVIQSSRKLRGHFISLLFDCHLLAPPDEALKYNTGCPHPESWAWHAHCPENLIPDHEMYRGFIDGAGH
jgi:colanic acid biosynthesis protein WcaH